jgi:undecaprenyl-diphosphatase
VVPTALLKHARAGLGAAASLALAAPALAQRSATAAPPPVRFEVRLVREAAVLAGLGTLALTPALLQRHLPYATCAPCSPRGLWGIDRGAVGVVDSAWSRAGDVALLATGAATALLLWTSRRGEEEPLRAAVEDGLVLAQAASLAEAATAWLKVIVQRPRPPRYTSEAPLYRDPDYGLSFPSGHATLAFAAAAAYWSIQQRRGQARRRAPEIVLLVALASVTAAARVEAHRHFPTDVAGGALIGAAAGWAWPRLHPLRRPPA